jgi:hypothetical protein
MKQQSNHAKAAPAANGQAHKPQHNLGKITKTFQQDGRWVEKTSKTAILICVCGTRYIKTRQRQVSCLRCMFNPAA